ncbi:MAG: hypothetical protein WD844_05340 [Thermoleophilaceae bacterium]
MPRAAAAVAGLAVAAWVSTRWVSLSPDARYSLAWGAELIRGDAPQVDAPEVSTPHPLPIVAGGLVSLLGARAAADVYAFGAVLAFALLVYAGFRLGRALGGTVAGVVAAALVATRERVDFFASRAFIDIPFAALVLLAAALAAEGPRRNATPALGLLALAGLLRPEAWGLAALYGGWVIVDQARPSRGQVLQNGRTRAEGPCWSARPDPGPCGIARPDPGPAPAATLALVAAAPAIWILFDLALTGDPFHSLHGTQENALLLERDTGLDDLGPSLRAGIEDLAGLAPAAAGAAFGAWGLVRFRRERPAFAVVMGLVGAGIAAFALLAVADLPLNDRYLVVPALALLALAAAAVPRATRSVVAAAAATLALVPAALALPDDLDAAGDGLEGAHSKARADEDLERLLSRDGVRAAIDRCQSLSAAASGRPAVAALLGRDPATVAISLSPVPPPGSATLSTSETVPPGTPRSVRVRAWTFVNRC